MEGDNKKVELSKFIYRFLSYTSIILKLFLVLYVVVSLVLILKIHSQDRQYDLPNLTAVKEPITATELDYSKQPYLGDPDAPVKLVEFGDFKCPACKTFASDVKPQLVRDYVDTGKVQFYFINYAFLDRDSYAAAMVGEILFHQPLGNALFWQYYDQLYAAQGDVSEIWATKEFLLNFVHENMPLVGIVPFKEELVLNQYLFDVKEDFKVAGALGVNGTPQFLVNGELYRINSYDELQAAIERAIGMKAE